MSDKYTLKKFSATNVAVGHRSSVQPGASVSPAVNDALDKLRYFVSLIPESVGQGQDSDDVRAQAENLEAALCKKKLNRERIEKILRNLMLGVSGVAALANAMDAVQSAVARLFN
jgi:hypothetical protein